MNKIVIFASGDVDALVRRLKIGTPSVEFICGDIVTEEIRNQIAELYPKQIESTIKLRRERLSNELMQSTKEIVIIDTEASTEFLEIYKKSAQMYHENREVINLTVSNGNSSDYPKEIFLISGEKYALLSGIISRESIAYLSIENQNPKDLESATISAVNGQFSLLTINTHNSDSESKKFLSRIGDRKEFSVVNINTLSDAPDTTEDTSDPENSTSASDTVKASELKIKLKKTKFLVTSWKNFIEELEEGAREKGLLTQGQRIEDDLTPKK